MQLPSLKISLFPPPPPHGLMLENDEHPSRKKKEEKKGLRRFPFGQRRAADGVHKRRWESEKVRRYPLTIFFVSKFQIL